MKHLLKLVCLISLCVLTGCTTPNQVLMNPGGQLHTCSASGAGLMGVAMATQMFNDCIKNSKALGYVEIERVGAVGINGQEEAGGLKIFKVADLSPAKTAGILPGDFLIKVGEQTITTAPEMRALTFGLAGTSVDLTIRRNNVEQKITVVRAPYSSVFGVK